MQTIRIAQFGCGPIGIETLRLLASKPWATVVGAVDIDPAKVGRTLADVTGVASFDAARVYGSFEELCEAEAVDVVLHTAGSKAEATIRQIEPIVRRGVSVASTCEELLFPAVRAPEAAAWLDTLCRKTGARVVGTGVNPGFVMDVIPVCLTGVSRSVRGIYAERVVDASTRRFPLQKKIGSGLDPGAFRQLYAEGRAGHAGFQESAALIARCMGWSWGDIRETLEPVVAEEPITTTYFEVRSGQVRGLHQVVTVHHEGRKVIEMDLKMYLGAPDPHDTVCIDGDPPLKVTFEGGVAGDHATVAALVNAVPRLLEAPAGLRLMTDLSVPCIADCAPESLAKKPITTVRAAVPSAKPAVVTTGA